MSGLKAPLYLEMPSIGRVQASRDSHMPTVETFSGPT